MILQNEFCKCRLRKWNVVNITKTKSYSLIPKVENNLSTLSNWHPITLLNVDYKILAKVIAKRIEPVLTKLIHPDQTEFIKGRFIGQNIRLLNDLMEFTDDQNVPGILLFIDYEKAFDIIEWTFIQNVLKCFNFGLSAL